MQINMQVLEHRHCHKGLYSQLEVVDWIPSQIKLLNLSKLR